MAQDPGLRPTTTIRLCGGPTVTQGGTRVDQRLPSRQSRMLFALLVLHRERALSREALADALWNSGTAPRSRDSSLRALLTGVRQVFGPDSVEGRESVRLRLPEGTAIDIEEARSALQEAERAVADQDFPTAARAAAHACELTAEELLPASTPRGSTRPASKPRSSACGRSRSRRRPPCGPVSRPMPSARRSASSSARRTGRPRTPC